MSNTYRTYAVGGWLLASDFPFITPLLPASGTPHLTFTCTSDAPRAICWDNLTPLHRNPLYVPQGIDELSIYRFTESSETVSSNPHAELNVLQVVPTTAASEAFDVLRFGKLADFYIWPARIICHLRQSAAITRNHKSSHDSANQLREYLENQFLTTVLAYWQEQRGLVVLHAAAVVHGSQAFALAAFSGGGKSSLTTALLQAGHALLADDNLTLQWDGERIMAAPSYPQVRLWAAQAATLLGSNASFHTATFTPNNKTGFALAGLGRFCNEAKPLSALYLLERTENPSAIVQLIDIPPAQAVFALARHSYVANQLNIAGRTEERLAFFARMVSQIAVRRLAYASGVEHLPTVCAMLAQDANS